LSQGWQRSQSELWPPVDFLALAGGSPCPALPLSLGLPRGFPIMYSKQPMTTHVLVADDEEAVRQLLTSFFRRQNWEVTSVATAEEALDCVAEQAFSVVVLDIELGAADGLAVLAQMKGLQNDLPVVMLTGLGLDEDRLQDAKRSGADGCLSKSLSLEQLKTEILRVLKSRS